ncbi:MAG: aminotransferase class I/II-fold pyridoxal phosphate-dependent enzyme [Ignisphaera sp.]
MRIHGGDREARIDFSSNLNPLGPPQIVYSIIDRCVRNRVLEKYPDYSYRDLRRALARFYRCREENVLPTAGAGEAVNLTLIAVRPRTVVVLEPSYGEYEDVSHVLGIEYRSVFYRRDGSRFYLDLSHLDEACLDEDTLIIVTNPNNPLGIYIDKNVLIPYLSRCRARVLVDEAYIELCSRCSIEIGHDLPKNIIFVRSLTKWLSLPGIRLGFLYTEDDELYRKIDIVRQPWNVNSLAECLALGLVEYENEFKEFIEYSRRYIEDEKKRLSRKLIDMGLTVFESDTNFILVEVGEGDHISRDLRKKGIAVRSCTSFKGLGPSFIRIAVRRAKENDELLDILSKEIALG